MMVTLQEVADAAGVSIATASWAVNNKQNVRISQSTREKVRRVARELGYHQNAMARSLARGKSDLIGFISDGVATTPFAGQVIRGAQDEAWRNGKTLLIIDTNGNKDIERQAFSFMRQRQVEGIVYSRWVHEQIAVPSDLDPQTSILVNCFDADHRLRSVVPDEVQGGRSATGLLTAAGHGRIAFVNDDKVSPATEGRLMGYKQALDASGLEFDSQLVFKAVADQEGGYGVADAVLKTSATAVFCHNDRMAMGLYDALRERGLNVPDDLSVVGFDNQEVISAHLHPALSTVGLPQYDLGVLGIRALLQQCSKDGGSSEVADSSAMNSDSRNLGFEPILVSCPVVNRDSIRSLR